jgi:hypothetical protein
MRTALSCRGEVFVATISARQLVMRKRITGTTKDDTHGRYPPGAMIDVRMFTPTDLRAVFAEVRTDHLVLRQPHGDDGPAVFAVHGDPATNRYNPPAPTRTVRRARRHCAAGYAGGKTTAMAIGPSRPWALGRSSALVGSCA